MSEMIIFQTEDRKISIDVRFDPAGETVWLTANQMAELFDRDEKTIRKHINHVFSEKELIRENNTQKVRVDGVKQPVSLYNLDGILTATGEQLLEGAGSVTHAQAIEKAHAEYRKYQQRTLSTVERDYLNAIRTLEEKTEQSPQEKR